jgi:ATP-binding cassette subfamily B multidrug efflux pump
MPEFYDGEESTKEYDPVLFRRLLAWARPYTRLIVLTVAALTVSTAGELFIPILVRNVLDDAVFLSYRSVDPSLPLSGSIREEFSTPTGARRFISKTEAAAISRAEEKRLVAAGSVSPDEWYVFYCGPDDPAGEVVRARSELFAAAADERNGAPGRLYALRMDDLKSLPQDERRLIRANDYAAIGTSALIFLAVLAAVLIATFVQSYAASLMGQRVMTDLRLSLFSHVCSQSLAFLSRHPVGRLVTRLTSDVETLNDFFTSVLVSFLKDVSIMVGVLIALFSLSPRLALVAVCTLPPVVAVTLVSRIKARDAFRKQRSAVSKVNSFLSERIAGVHVVQMFSKEKESTAEFVARDKELLAANLGEMYVFASFRPLVDFLSALTTAAVIGAGAYFYLGSAVSLGVLIAFVSLVGMFYSPVQDISEKYTMLQSAMAGAERIFTLLDTNERIPDLPAPPRTNPIAGRIEFKSVRFAYKQGEEVLKGLSFSVEPGETVAIVGYTGAGKTTVTNLLARLWDADSGEILIDGVPIRDFPLAELRSSVLSVLQDVFLFSGTVADNIRLGSDVGDAGIRAAAKAVHADEFISRLPDGYETVLSEGATNISSGQRQLISFARVVAHDPRVVILDEATSSVDSETERLIQKGLERVLNGRTAIVIAHRLSTIRHADRILVLSGGRLVEQGAHADLIALNGMYANLYRLQYERLRS